MALLQNQSLLGQYPVRHLGGAASPFRALWGRGERRNGLNAMSPTAAVPNGYLAPAAWVLPRKAGGMSSHDRAEGVLTVAALNMAQGMALDGSAILELSVPSAAAAALAPLEGTATLELTVANASGAGVANLDGAAVLELTASASLGGVASVTGTAEMELTTASTLRADGFMIAEPIDEALTPDAIAESVWSALASANNTPGTMGAFLNAAGAGGDPWAVTLEGTYTASDLLRIMASVLAGKVSGMESGSPVFRSITDASDVVAATTTADGNRTGVTVTP